MVVDTVPHGMSDARFGYVTEATVAAFTDLYELTMMEGFLDRGHTPRATFSLFFRELPPNRGYVVACGLEHVVSYLDSLRFDGEILDYLSERGFGADFLSFLSEFEFSGEVRAVPEGTPVFPQEPLLEVTAPIQEAQLFETLCLNQMGFPSLVATKAARMADVIRRRGDDQSLVDFGSRRAHGTDAGVKAARAASVGGFDGTSNVAAGVAFGVPTFGTMAHSWVQSFPTEREAFEAFVRTHGEDSILLVDTYDTVEGTKLAREVAESTGVDVRGVRLDSGELAALSNDAAAVLDGTEVGIYVSSGVDEYALVEFFDAGGVADGFGPGTSVTTVADGPKLDVVYKLVAVERDGEMRPSMKLSTGKATYPGAKSVRRREDDGTYVGDVVGERGEFDEELLVTVYDDGERVWDPPSLDALRERTAREVSKLPAGVRRVENPAAYEVRVSDRLDATTADLRATLQRE